MPQNNSQIINNLSELLGEYQDLESQSYLLQKNMLLNEGITIGIRDIKISENACYLNNKFLKTNITFSELLQTKVTFIKYLSFHRKQSYAPCLFMEDSYELSFSCGSLKSEYKVSGTLSDLTLRINPTTKKKQFSNFIQSLTNDFIDHINTTGSLDIHVKLIHISDSRLKCEAQSKILDTDLYVQDLLSSKTIYGKLRFSNGIDKANPKTNRLYLWGLESFSSENNRKKTKTLELMMDKIPPLYDHGIKNCIHLKALIDNLDNKVLTNDELLNPSLEVIDLINKHLNFQQILINKLPYS